MVLRSRGALARRSRLQRYASSNEEIQVISSYLGKYPSRHQRREGHEFLGLSSMLLTLRGIHQKFQRNQGT